MMSKGERESPRRDPHKKVGPSTKFLARVGGPQKGSSSSSTSVDRAVVAQKKRVWKPLPRLPTAQAAPATPTFFFLITMGANPLILHTFTLIFWCLANPNYPHPMFDGGRCGSSMPCTFLTVFPRG